MHYKEVASLDMHYKEVAP